MWRNLAYSLLVSTLQFQRQMASDFLILKCNHVVSCRNFLESFLMVKPLCSEFSRNLFHVRLLSYTVLDIQCLFSIWKLQAFISGTLFWGSVFPLGKRSWWWNLSMDPKFHHVFSTTFCFAFLLYSLWELLNFIFQNHFIFNFWCLCLIPKYSFLLVFFSVAILILPTSCFLLSLWGSFLFVDAITIR